MRHSASRDDLDSTAPLRSVGRLDGTEGPERAGDPGAAQAAVTSGPLYETPFSTDANYVTNIPYYYVPFNISLSVALLIVTYRSTFSG
jgi:hypothetical protein